MASMKKELNVLDVSLTPEEWGLGEKVLSGTRVKCVSSSRTP
jgi:hypothetical protein